MAIIKKYSSFENLSNYKTFIIDDEPNSEFFKVSEFNETVTGGKNGFLIEGSPFLRETTELKIEVLDTEGNPMYYEPGSGIPEYYEGTSILVAIHVYDDTPIGIGQITILGEIKTYETEDGLFNVPSQWKDVYNVKWQKKFKINKLLANEDKVRFYKRPLISITEIVKPIFTLSIPSVDQTGTVIGIPQSPSEDQSLDSWTKGTTYLLHTNDSTRWTGSAVGSVITVDTPIPYTPTITEIINSTEIIVDTPYTVNNVVKPFTSTPYGVTFDDIDNQLLEGSSLTGSFAQIKMSNLKTFVGDVARVKIYRKTRNEVGDYQFVQETKLESTELLRDLTTQTDTEISYGNLNQSNLDTYWVSSSNDHPITINTDILLNSIKVDYDYSIGGIQRLETDEFIDISTDVEYTLSFKTLLSGSVNSTKYIKAYLSSSDYSQDILQINSINDYKQRTIISENIIAETSSLAKLVFDVSGSDWYISTISLRNSQETSFSPDEFTLVQDVPRKLPTETFDYKFEFYDINNNYIPVDVLATKEFNGGNLTDGLEALPSFTFTAPIPYFRFATGSIGNPIKQTLPFSVTTTVYTGSVTYASAALDTDGNYINPASYTGAYPGALSNANDFGASAYIGNFTGSDSSYTIGTMIYTASIDTGLEILERYQRIDRIEEGLSTSELFATSNTNQFYYRASTLEGNPATQEISIQVKRKNLTTIIADITARSSSLSPPLTEVSDVNGTKTYKIAVTDFPYTYGEATYEFTGSDQFGLLYSDDIVITPIINYSAVSVDVTNPGTAFQANSDGVVQSSEYDRGDGLVSVLVGSESASFSQNLTSVNTFNITSSLGSSGVTVNESVPTTNSYGISNMSVDQGQINLTIGYKDGSGTITSFQKLVSYSKIRASKPTAVVTITPQAQVVNASGSGELTGTPENPELSVLEGATTYVYGVDPLSNGEFRIVGVTGIDVFTGDFLTTPVIELDYDGSGLYSTLSDTNFGDVSYEYQNSSGVLISGSLIFSIAKARNGNGADVILPDGLITGSDQLTGSLDDHYVTLLTDQDISGSKTFDTGDTRERIIVRNGNNTDGIKVYNTSSGNGLFTSNTSTAGNAISVQNTTTGNGILLNNQGRGDGIDINNTTVDGVGIKIRNTSTGWGSYLLNQSAGTGSFISNDSSGNGLQIDNNSSGNAIRIDNYSTGDALVVNSQYLGIGSNNIVSSYLGTDNFWVDKVGAVTGLKFVKNAATSDDVLLGDGTTTSLSGIGGTDIGNWIFNGDILSNGGITLNGSTNTITTTTLNVTNIIGTVFANLKTQNGYQYLGGGTIIQWGYSTAVSNSIIYFPLTFPSACRYTGVTSNRTSSGSRGFNHANSLTRTSFRAVHDGGAGGCWWMAIGY